MQMIIQSNDFFKQLELFLCSNQSLSKQTNQKVKSRVFKYLLYNIVQLKLVSYPSHQMVPPAVYKSYLRPKILLQSVWCQDTAMDPSLWICFTDCFNHPMPIFPNSLGLAFLFSQGMHEQVGTATFTTRVEVSSGPDGFKLGLFVLQISICTLSETSCKKRGLALSTGIRLLNICIFVRSTGCQQKTISM